MLRFKLDTSYFADPHSPWQRGSNENANRLIREYLPKGADLSGIVQLELNAIVNRLNNRPRRILNYRTPREVFAKLLEQEQQKNLTHLDKLTRLYVVHFKFDTSRIRLTNRGQTTISGRQFVSNHGIQAFPFGGCFQC